jgi:hypothetical protein
MTDKQIVWVRPGGATPSFEARQPAAASFRFAAAEPGAQSLMP